MTTVIKTGAVPIHRLSALAGSERRVKSAFIAYTLIEPAKLNGVDPHAWLTDVLSRIDELLPWRHTKTS